MKAFLASVAAAILIIIIGSVVMQSGAGMRSQDIYRSEHGSVRL